VGGIGNAENHSRAFLVETMKAERWKVSLLQWQGSRSVDVHGVLDGA